MAQRQGQVEADGSPAVRNRQAAPRPAPRPDRQRTSPVTYVHEVRSELRKVAWPSRDEVANYSTVVFGTLVILVAMIFLLNYAFSHAISALFGT
jgi:preprotein translocase subunit SecE